MNWSIIKTCNILYICLHTSIKKAFVKKVILIFLLTAVFANSFSQVGNTITLSEKIYGLSRFWGDVNYNYVYLNKINPEEWSKAYLLAIDEIQQTKNDYEYYRVLQKLCAVLKDGHTQIYPPDEIQGQVMNSMFGNYRLFLMNVENKTIIVQTNKSKEKEIPVGSEVVEVNVLSTKDYQKKYVSPYISASTRQTIEDKSANQLLSGLAGEQYDVAIKTPGGEIKRLHLVHSKTSEEAVNPPFLSNPETFSFRWLKEGIAYIALNSFEDTSVVNGFIKKWPETRTAKAIILDLRINGGGSSINARNIAKYFVAGDIIYGPRNYSREIIPTDRAIGSFLEAKDTVNGKPEWGISAADARELYASYTGSRFHEYEYKPDTVEKVEKIKVPVVILTGTMTASAAEDFLIYLNGQTNTTGEIYKRKHRSAGADQPAGKRLSLDLYQKSDIC